jgi:hypothetical protein
MKAVTIRIVSNDGDTAIGIDQDSGKEVSFSRKDVGASEADFRSDLVPGETVSANRTDLPERAAEARYRQLTKDAKKKHQG